MLIELKDVNKTYQGAQPLHVLKGIDLTIGKGEFVSIMGASGSGKSTLLNILGILDNYDSGEYRINGNLIWNLSETKAAEYRNKMIGFIFQSYNLIGFKTAAENVEVSDGRSVTEWLWNSLIGLDLRNGRITIRTRCPEVRSRGWRSPAR